MGGKPAGRRAMAATMYSTTSTTAQVTQDYLPALARLLLCSLFIWDGVLQLRDPAGTVSYFESVNVPSPQIAVWVSIGVHLPAGDMENMTHFYKNLVMAGGLLYVIAFGPGAFALDRS